MVYFPDVTMSASYSCGSIQRTVVLLTCSVLVAAAGPKVFNFNDLAFQSEVLRYGNPNVSDYFRLLEVDGEHLIIGAADSVHNISIATFQNVSTYYWQPGEDELDDCLMKAVDQDSCRNYIRVLSRDEHTGQLLVCGTNAYRPLCRVLDRQGAVMLEFVGVGLSPLDPKHNTTFYKDADSDYLYAATVADFSGTDALIFRRNISRRDDRGLRTQRNSPLVLNRPQFVGTLHSHKYVYFFFREEAIEEDSATFSRVARVCKNDKGGPSSYETEWTSFAKARLNCSVPEKNKPFYFDEIISVSNVTSDPKNRIMYATFVSEFNFLRHSVICAFRLEDIDRLFDRSDYVALDAERHRWVRRKRDEKTQKIGQCANNSRRISGDEALTLRKYPLFADAVPNVFGRAVGIHRGNDHYNQIVVLEGVEIQEGRADVLYVGTDQGNILKMVNLIGFSQDEGEDPVVPVAVYEVSKLPIRRLLISRNRYLIAVTDPVVYRIPLHFCSSYESCDECVASRDPHCVWHESQCTQLKNVQQKFAYQDVLLKKTDVCREERLKTAAFRPSHKDAPIVIPPLTPRNDSGNVELLSPTDDKCVCDNGKLKKDLGPQHKQACNCAGSKHIVEPAAVITSEYDEPTSYPWWAWIIVVLALAQTVGLVYLCWKLYARRNAKKHIKQPLSASEVISAYSPTSMMTTSTSSGVSTLSRKTQTPSSFGLQNGTLRSKTAKPSKSYGDISIQLEGSAAPSMMSINHVT